ncbi:MAG: VacJ family lipoprotein [Nitrospinae bacterium]|nr:VacJ family lipoprotein [Nitrospinota bacterium]
MIKRFWRCKEAGLFLCLMFQWAFVPITVTANAFSGTQGAGHSGNSLPQFIYEVDGTLVAQTSEITILLEKQIPPGIDRKEENPLIPEIDKKQGFPFQESGALTEGLEIEGSSQEMGQTAQALETAPPVEFYEELEDPFGPPPGEEIPELKDPFVGYNRWMYNVNEGLYDYLMEPLAKGWRFVVPEDFRIVIRNAFDNAISPVKLFSSLIQGDLDKSGRVLGRLLINTTAGLGGMLDVAGQEYGIENVDEDFDQALGHYDVPTGPYIVLPFFGPSTARNLTGRVVDSFLSPSIFFAPSFLVSAGITVGETTNDVSFIIDDKKALAESAIDEYESVRDFYHQYREGLVNK